MTEKLYCKCGSKKLVLHCQPCFDGPVFCVKCNACGAQSRWKDTRGQALHDFEFREAGVRVKEADDE